MSWLDSTPLRKSTVLFLMFLLLAGCGSADKNPIVLEGVTNSIGMSFLVVPPGKFRMGSNRGGENERPIHEVTISRAYGLGVTEVTEQQYTTVMGKSPGLEKPANAINSLSWNQANEFCQRLSELPEEKAAGQFKILIMAQIERWRQA